MTNLLFHQTLRHCATRRCCVMSGSSAALAMASASGGCSACPPIALIPLSLYFVASVLWLATSDRITAAAWLASPVSALLVMLFVLAGLAHALVGLRSVFLDYVHTRARLVAAGLFIRAAAVLLAGASVLAILKLFLGH